MKKYLPSSTFKFILITLIIIFYTRSFVKAQGTIITLSGYNEDVIADAVLNTTPASLTSNSVDVPAGAGDVFFSQGYSNNSIPFANGLPANGQFTSSAGHKFQLAPYDANNDLRMEALQSGTLTFAIPDQIAYDTLFVLGTAGNGPTNVVYTINFTDATTTTGSFSIDDWFCVNCTPYGIKDLNRVTEVAGDLDGSNQFAIREYTIALSVGDQSKQIVSIDFSVPAAEEGAANIFGIAAVPSVVLPISLEYFTAKVENGKAVLQWKTSQEINNKQFIIERATSAQPSVFMMVGEVPTIFLANGSVYNFVDGPNLAGTYFYRLVQVDINGNRKILGTKSIAIKGKTKWIVQDFGSEWKLICEQPFIYRVLDMDGHVLKAATGSGSATISKPTSHGIYQIQVLTGGDFSTQKLLK